MDDRTQRDHNTDAAGDNVRVEKGRRPSKGVLIEWRVADEGGEWPSAEPAAAAAFLPVHARRRRWWTAATVTLFTLLALGGWLWHEASTGLSRLEGELQQAVVADEWQSVPAANQEVQPSAIVSAAALAPAQPAPGNLQTQLIKLQDDWAIVRVTLTKGGLLFRQTRVYRRGARGWLPDSPVAPLWGAPATLETGHFIFHYYALDRDAVATAAVKLNALYPDLAESYALDPAIEGQRQIWVSPQTSGQSLEQSANDGLQESSPGLYLAPADLSEGDILAQAIFLDLLALYTVQYRESIGTLNEPQAMARVDGLLTALRLWQSWRSELPLGALYKPAIQWLYSDRQGVRQAPAFDAHLCPLHRLWQTALPLILIPLFCGERTLQAYESGRYFPISAPRSLEAIHLFRPAPADEVYSGITETEWVGLATLIDYAATTYGRQSLEKLIANAATHARWETLIPASFGVPAAEFEKGWLGYLHNQYGVAR